MPPGKHTGEKIPLGQTREHVMREIIRGLYDGQFKPGQRIRESQLTAAYKISRGPAREALNALAAMNILTLIPQRGAVVRTLTIPEAIDTLIVAQSLIGLAARLAAECDKSETALAKLKNASEVLQSCSQQTSEADYAEARDRFYGALTTMAGNAELSRLLPLLRVHLIRVQFASILRADDPDWYHDYQDIADAIAAGNKKQAEGAACAHIGRAIRRLRALL
ncbi:GntR family transcriptional regulator [Altererythrobacter salegens]|uniref:GntR family transcriptional regulator n=1 Tax=Croceibacterium salegens TaxID=1737568 RepID=A0A6I4SZ33_9SPHN|nr:GntR family transcriptional regulator [Croceibacterium salegens]MXO60639.1 GntR family transcriptional regulator [Croceibacterium salegens]